MQVENRMNWRWVAIATGSIFFLGCGGSGDNCQELDKKRQKPSDRPAQLEFSQALVSPDSDADGDGVLDFFDIDPGDATKKAPSIRPEVEFNNNIQQATPVPGTWPLLLKGTLANGAGYVVDSDYFAIDAKAGERVGIWVYKGEWSDSDQNLVLAPDLAFAPQVAVVDALGVRIHGRSLEVHGIGSMVAVAFATTGTHYIEISDIGITETTYSYPYVVFADFDSDFDGLRDTWEIAIGSDPNAADSDGDGIDDFTEAYWFLAAEKTLTPDGNVWDPDGDGIPNFMDVDSDGDGIPDALEGADDSDGDGLPNFLDLDANQDGIADSDQVGEYFHYPSDQDNDGIPDFLDMDVDGDGIPNRLDREKKLSGPACSFYVKNEPGNIYDEGALSISGVYARLGDAHLPEVAPHGAVVTIVGRGFDDDTRILFPTAVSAVAVKPKNVAEDGLSLSLTVPAGSVSGSLLAMGAGRISNPYDVRIVDAYAPLLTSATPNPSERGATLELSGYNLAGGEVKVGFIGSRAMTEVVVSGYATAITLWIPDSAPSGDVYVSVDGVQTNRLPLAIARTISISTIVPGSADTDEGDFVLSSTYRDIEFDERDFSVDISVAAGDVDAVFVLAYGKKGEPYAIYEAMVFPEDTELTVDAMSSAIKAVFDGLGYVVSQPLANLPRIREVIEDLQEVENLAETMAAQLEKQPKAMAEFTDAKIVKAYKKAVEAAAVAVAEEFGEGIGFAPVVPEFDPAADQFDIYLKPIKEADLKLQNDTKLFLSARVTTVDGTEVRPHIGHPWDGNIIGPQGWGLLFVSTDVDVPVGGRDSHFDIATAGGASPRTYDGIHAYLVTRLILDGIVLPVANEYALKRVLGQKLNSKDAAEVIIDLVGPQNWNSMIQSVINDPDNMVRTIKTKVFDVIVEMFMNSCLQLPPGDTCQKFALAVGTRLGISKEKVIATITKRLGVGAAAMLVPVLNKIIAAWETIGQANTWGSIAVSAIDMVATPGTVEFDVDYPLQIDDVKPACYVRPEDKPDDAPPMLVVGKGFAPVPDGALWWKRDVYPEVFLAGEKGAISTVKADGTSMLVKWPDAYFSDGEYNVIVKHQGQEVESEASIELVSSGIYLEALQPDAGPTGITIRLEGCGFSKVAGENIVTFASDDGKPAKGVVVAASETSLDVIVPVNAKTGDVSVKVGNRESGALEYTVEEASVTITYGDCGSATDDTFALYVDGALVSSMPAPATPFPVQVNLAAGNHVVSMVGITAPDDIGTYCIDFSSNVTVLSGPSQSGGDMTAGVRKTWQIKVNAAPGASGGARKPSAIEGLRLLGLPG